MSRVHAKIMSTFDWISKCLSLTLNCFVCFANITNIGQPLQGEKEQQRWESKEREKNAFTVATLFCLQCPKSAHALCSD